MTVSVADYTKDKVMFLYLAMSSPYDHATRLTVLPLAAYSYQRQFGFSGNPHYARCAKTILSPEINTKVGIAGGNVVDLTFQ